MKTNRTLLRTNRMQRTTCRIATTGGTTRGREREREEREERERLEREVQAQFEEGVRRKGARVYQPEPDLEPAPAVPTPPIKAEPVRVPEGAPQQGPQALQYLDDVAVVVPEAPYCKPRFSKMWDLLKLLMRSAYRPLPRDHRVKPAQGLW